MKFFYINLFLRHFLCHTCYVCCFLKIRKNKEKRKREVREKKKDNIHNKYGTRSLLRKGCYNRISCQKYEFAIILKVVICRQKTLYLFHRNYKFSYTSQIHAFDMKFCIAFMKIFFVMIERRCFFNKFTFLVSKSHSAHSENKDDFL